MIKVLLTNLTGYPTPNSGGSNKIIYEILKNLDYGTFQVDYCSYNLFRSYINRNKIMEKQGQFQSKKKQFGQYLASKFRFYKSITSNFPYLGFYYLNVEAHFVRLRERLHYYDIVHSHDPFSSYYFSKSTIPIKIITLHSKGTATSEFEERFKENRGAKNFLARMKSYETSAIQTANLITFPSSSAKAFYFKGINLNESTFTKFKIIYNGIDIELIKNVKPDLNLFNQLKIDIKKYDLLLLSIAQHVKPKNIDLIINSMKILKSKYSKNPLLINVGDGYLTKELIKIIYSNNLEDNVRLIGNMDNLQVIQLMKSFHYLIIPSEKVVFDMVVLESLACGLCVIASDCGGNSEIIKDSVNGYLLKEISPEGIAQKIILADREKVKDNGILTARKYSSKRMVNNYEEAYKNLIRL